MKAGHRALEESLHRGPAGVGVGGGFGSGGPGLGGIFGPLPCLPISIRRADSPYTPNGGKRSTRGG